MARFIAIGTIRDAPKMHMAVYLRFYTSRRKRPVLNFNSMNVSECHLPAVLQQEQQECQLTAANRDSIGTRPEYKFSYYTHEKRPRLKPMRRGFAAIRTRIGLALLSSWTSMPPRDRLAALVRQVPPDCPTQPSALGTSGCRTPQRPIADSTRPLASGCARTARPS